MSVFFFILRPFELTFSGSCNIVNVRKHVEFFEELKTFLS